MAHHIVRRNGHIGVDDAGRGAIGLHLAGDGEAQHQTASGGADLDELAA